MAHFHIQNLTFSYPGSSKKALDDVSLCIEKGAYFVICGQSGSGKTTLLRHLKTVWRLTELVAEASFLTKSP